MMNAADIRPVAPSHQTQSTAALSLIFVGASIVATTLQATKSGIGGRWSIVKFSLPTV